MVFLLYINRTGCVLAVSSKKSSSTVTVESRDLPINRDLSIGDERDDGDELHRERTGSRTSFTAGKFER